MTTSDRKFQITPRDIEFFKKLLECRAMTRWHVEALFYSPSSRSQCLTRLRYFTDGEIIKRLPQKGFYYEGRKPFVYVPTQKTVQVVAEKEYRSVDTIEWDGRELQADNIFIRHILDITSVNVAFTIAAKSHGFTTETWLSTPMMRRKSMIDRVEITGPRGAIDKVALEPDAFTIIYDTQYTNNLFIEVDRGTEDRQTIARKIYAYRSYMTPPSLFEQRYGTNKARILYITLTEKRMLTLKEICESCGGRARFWFAVLSDLQTHDPFTDKIWRKAGSAESYSLIW